MEELHKTLLMGNYGKGTLKNYLGELRLLFQYHHAKDVEQITDHDITDYVLFIKSVHGVGRAKCKMVAQSCAFFFKHIIKKPFVLPSKLYPRKDFVLPAVMTQEEVKHLLTSITDIRQRALISLLYGTGIRIGEAKNMRFTDIDRAGKRILIRQGKGNKDRYTLLPQIVLDTLAIYYYAYRPATYLFESKQFKNKPLHERSMQIIVNAAMTKAGFASGKYTAHTLRHSFATHLLDNDCNIHTIKTLLGHAKIETTMVYLHLQQNTRNAIVSPVDFLMQVNG